MVVRNQGLRLHRAMSLPRAGLRCLHVPLLVHLVVLCQRPIVVVAAVVEVLVAFRLRAIVVVVGAAEVAVLVTLPAVVHRIVVAVDPPGVVVVLAGVLGVRRVLRPLTFTFVRRGWLLRGISRRKVLW